MNNPETAPVSERMEIRRKTRLETAPTSVRGLLGNIGGSLGWDAVATAWLLVLKHVNF